MKKSTIAICALLLAACADSGDGDPGASGLMLVSIEAPVPLIEGSTVRVGAIGARGAPLLTLRDGSARVTLSPDGAADGDGYAYALDADDIAVFGPGERALSATIDDGRGASDPWQWRTEFADTLDVDTPRFPGTTLHWEQPHRVEGAGFVHAGEGTQGLHFLGTFTPDEGEPIDVDTTVPLTPTEPSTRTRATFVPPAGDGGLGDGSAGSFAGSVTLVTRLASGDAPEAPPATVLLRMLPPSLVSITPASFGYGEFLYAWGTGYENTAEVRTFVHLVGAFTGPGGAHEVDVEVEADWLSDGRLRLWVEPYERSGRLYSAWFDDRFGVFDGVASVISASADTFAETAPIDVSLTLDPATQVVRVRFAEDFDEGLALFGLAAARTEIVAAVLTRLEALYAGFRVDIVTVSPQDRPRSVVTELEIAGIDPERRGVVALDTAAGEDDGNLLLGDVVGGANAAMYGGVFVDAFLGFSPTDPAERVSPEALRDEAFDAVFADVRAAAATREELDGAGDPVRVAAIGAAVEALSEMIAEEAAHMLGHALGAGAPDDPSTWLVDGEPGCLMNPAESRTFAIRAGLDEGAATRLCADARAYLGHIHAN